MHVIVPIMPFVLSDFIFFAAFYVLGPLVVLPLLLYMFHDVLLPLDYNKKDAKYLDYDEMTNQFIWLSHDPYAQ